MGGDSHDDVQASLIGEACSQVDHGHRRALCAKKESAQGLRGAIPGSEALGRKGLTDLAREKERGAGV
jgi:hypothetical protein